MDSFIIATVFGIYAFAAYIFYTVNQFAKGYMMDRERIWTYLHKLDRATCSEVCEKRTPIKLERGEK